MSLSIEFDRRPFFWADSSIIARCDARAGRGVSPKCGRPRDPLHSLEPLFCHASRSAPRGSPFGAALVCSSESASWLASRGRRPLQWTFPLDLRMPISTWKGCSARAPRVAFKQWSFEQLGVAKGSRAPPCPPVHAFRRASFGQYPLCNQWGSRSLVLSGHAISAVAARCAARGTVSAACRRASLARRREDRWSLSIDSRTQRICRVQHARRQLADAGS